MKTIKNLAKIILISVALIFNINTHSQESNKVKGIFVRVYNLEGKKINKGHIVFLNDSILELKKGQKTISVDVNHIGLIKTKHSGGHNVLIGSLVGATVGAISGATFFEPDPPDTIIYSLSRGDNAGIGAILGAFGGAAVGGILSGTKNSETYIINGDAIKWQIFKEFIEN